MVYQPFSWIMQTGFSSLPQIVDKNLICSPSAVSIPSLFGAEILSITALPLTNITGEVEPTNGFPFNITSDLDICNITVTYTHPGQNDSINVYILLPSIWNTKFQGVGGSGWITGSPLTLTAAAAEGFAAATTDGGHSFDDISASSWAQVSPGNINHYLLNDFASVSLNDMTLIGKQITESYYGQEISYSYFNGCSTGGRQGLMLAQRYPSNYNGILAAAPGVNWAHFIVAEYWPQFMMNQLDYFPSPCELDGITAAAIASCDGLDGVLDGIIARPDLCFFAASSVVGQEVSCSNNSTLITTKGAKIAQAIWTGPISSSGKSLWYGLNPGTTLEGLAGTICSPNSNENCTTSPFIVPSEWLSLFVTRNTSLDTSTLTLDQYSSLFRASINQFDSIIGTRDPDLTGFKDFGGKMITWHGLADQLIFPNNTVDYYGRVETLDSNVRDYYRFFEAPGVRHCIGGKGAFPGNALSQLMEWVEEGVAPEMLQAVGTAENGTVSNLALCQWPLVSKYLGGNTTLASSYKCVQK